MVASTDLFSANPNGLATGLPKNQILSASGADLGLGDALQSQVSAMILERRKQTMAVPGQLPGAAYGALGLGVASPGGGPQSAATQSLLGQGSFSG